MTYQPLARKWRPHRLDDRVAQGRVLKALTGALTHRRVSHAFPLTRARGMGTTTVARIVTSCPT